MKIQYNLKQIVIISCLIGLIAGIAIGMIIQQIMITQSVAKAGQSWEGVISNMNVEVDINETKLVEATYKIIPMEELNQNEPE